MTQSKEMPQRTLRGFLSPFRYPGGKHWFVKTARKWLLHEPIRPSIIVEPFAGGAGISLAAVYNKWVDRAIFAEIDENVAATWKTLLNKDVKWLINEVSTFRLGRRNVERAILSNPSSIKQRAFRCLLWNRTARGGVTASGSGLIRKGEDGNGLQSRWYPETLVHRIREIRKLRKRLKFVESDGFELIQKHLKRKDVAFFVDPPYTRAARRLYTHWEIDHEKLFTLLHQARGCVLMTYDDTAEVRALAKKYGFQIKRISMRTTHHQKKRELMICKSFDWATQSQRDH